MVTKSPIVRHVGLPSVASLALLALYFTPVEVLGCVNRGLMAVGVVLFAMVGAIVTTAIGAGAVREGRAQARWWLVTSVVLLLPALLLLRLA
ncbi:MAG: hypothetical protein ACREOU_16005 [Candidatus Eiseniibacteriota bacterium]